MSSAPPVRRTDKLMSEEDAHRLLARGHCARVATVGADGALLHVGPAVTDADVLGRSVIDARDALRAGQIASALRAKVWPLIAAGKVKPEANLRVGQRCGPIQPPDIEQRRQRQQRCCQ